MTMATQSTENIEEERVELIHGKDNNDVRSDPEAESLASETTNSGLPVDRGWAWVILFAAIFEVFIYGGIMKSYGLFFVQFQQRFGSNASETTLIQTVMNVVTSVTGIFVMTIGMKHMTARTSINIGALLTVIAYIVAGYTTHFEVLIVFLGGVAGLAAAMIYLPIVSTIGIYFNKRRGLANSITVAGASLGSLIFGPLFSFLFEYYGYSGTMLICAGLLCNIFVTGCLIRPPEFWTNKKSIKDSPKELLEIKGSREVEDGDNDTYTVFEGGSDHLQNGYIANDEFSDEHGAFTEQHTGKKHKYVRTMSEPPISEETPESPETPKRLPQFAALNYRRSRAQSFDPETSTNHGTSSPIVQRRRAGTVLSTRERTISETDHDIHYHNHNILEAISASKIALYSAADIMGASLASLNLANPLIQVSNIKQEEETDIVVENVPERKTFCQRFKSSAIDFLRTVFDLSLLRDPVFIHYVVFAFVSLPASIMTNAYFIPFAKDTGISNKNCGILLFVIGCVDLISRICVGIIADRKILRPTTIVTVAFVVMAVVNNMTRLVNSFWTMLVFVIVQGSFSGVYLALYAVILVEILGMDKFSSSLGFTCMFHGAAVAAMFPITGWLRDITGNYYWTYHTLSIFLLIGAIAAFTLPYTHRRCQKNKSENTNG